MKKITFLFSALILISNCFSQTTNVPYSNIGNGYITNQNNITRHQVSNTNAKPPLFSYKKMEKSTGFNLWVEPIGAIMTQKGIDLTGSSTGQSQSTFVEVIYQDSTVTISDASNGTYSVSNILLGSVLDPTSQYLQPSFDPIVTSTDPYYIDSIAITGSYVKVTSAIDTLYTWVVWGDTTNTSLAFTKALYSALWIAPLSGFRYESIGPKVTGASSAQGNVIRSNVPASNMILVKYILQNTDSSTISGNGVGLKNIFIPLPNVLTIPAGNIVSCYYTFVPGGTHSLGDCSFSFAGAPTSQNVNGFAGTVWGQTSPAVSSLADYTDEQVDPTSWCTGSSYNNQGRYAETTFDGFVWGNPITAPRIYYHIYGSSSAPASQPPVADFTMVADSANPFNYWTFNASTGNNLSYYWDFGDGATSYLQSPTHTYASAGSYTVCLYVTNAVGSNSICHSVTVSGTPNTCMALFNIAHDTSSINPNAYTVTNLSFGSNLSYLWNFGDTTTSTLAHPLHNYLGAGPYQLCLTVNNGAGCVQTYCDSLFAVDSLHSHLQPIAVTVVQGPPESTTVGINAVSSNSEIVIAPNPFTSQTTITFSDDEWRTIKITDVVGKEIKTIAHVRDRKVIIEKGDMQAGIYFVQITSVNKNVVNRKIIIK